MFVFESIMSILYLYLVASVAANPSPNPSPNTSSSLNTGAYSSSSGITINPLPDLSVPPPPGMSNGMSSTGGSEGWVCEVSAGGGGALLWGYPTAQKCPWPAQGQGLGQGLAPGQGLGLASSGSFGLSGKELFIVVSPKLQLPLP